MITKEVIEGLLYITDHRELTTDCLLASHILNDDDRNWQPIQHSEFYFINSFKYCTYLIIIDKQVHVYLIGDRAKGRTYNILSINGFSCEHFIMSKSEFISYIKEESKESDLMYLPQGFGQRIIYLSPDYENNICESYIFNRQTLDSNLFRKSKWSFGTDIYSVNQPEYTTKADIILKEILSEIDW